MSEHDIQKDILHLIQGKSKLKRDVFELSKLRFKELKACLEEYIKELAAEVKAIDPRLEVSYKDLNDYYIQITIAGDTLIFALHSNIFFFPDNSPEWTTSYLKNDVSKAYCGIIQVYNFLADSVRYNREKDAGYLIARLFLNVDNHFFVEGKRELGLMFNNFMNDEFEPDRMKTFLMAVIRHSINFDLYTPNYENISLITLSDANKLKENVSLKTGKRLGFQFGIDRDSSIQ